MNAVFCIDDYTAQYNRIRKSGRIIANNFLSAADIAELASQTDSVLAWNEFALALVGSDNGVARLHFYLASLGEASALAELLRGVAPRPLVADCVGKREKVEPLAEALCASGFSVYTTLHRWHSTSVNLFAERFLQDEMFRFASREDAGKVEDILCRTFDPLVSHLPDREKILRLIGQRLVYLAVREGEPVALVCLEKVGKLGIYLYQDAVIEECRSSGIGILLLQYALRQHKGCMNYTSWTEDTNKPSNRMHRMLGMVHDGLMDIVLLAPPSVGPAEGGTPPGR